MSSNIQFDLHVLFGLAYDKESSPYAAYNDSRVPRSCLSSQALGDQIPGEGRSDASPKFCKDWGTIMEARETIIQQGARIVVVVAIYTHTWPSKGEATAIFDYAFRDQRNELDSRKTPQLKSGRVEEHPVVLALFHGTDPVAYKQLWTMSGIHTVPVPGDFGGDVLDISEELGKELRHNTGMRAGVFYHELASHLIAKGDRPLELESASASSVNLDLDSVTTLDDMDTEKLSPEERKTLIEDLQHVYRNSGYLTAELQNLLDLVLRDGNCVLVRDHLLQVLEPMKGGFQGLRDNCGNTMDYLQSNAIRLSPSIEFD